MVEGAEEPLSPEQLAALQELAAKPSVVLPVRIVPATGLYPHEFAHIHRDWIEFATNNNSINYHTITIPDREPCRRKKAKYGSSSGGLLNTGFTSRDQPCAYCQKRGDEDCFTAPHRNDSNRTIPITDKKASEILKWWFSKFETIPWQYAHESRLRKVAMQIIKRPVNLTGLRLTFAARAAVMGIEQDTVLDFMGINGNYPTSRLYQIFTEYSAMGVDPDGILKQRTYHSYLQLLSSEGPLAIKEIAEHFNTCVSTPNRLMNKYEKLGLVKKTQEWINGVQPALWINAVEPGTPVVCGHNGCNEKFMNLKKKTQHERTNHNLN